MITEERKADLESAGYYVVDMGTEYGEGFQGQFRWEVKDSDLFQDWGTSDSPEDAWEDADRHHRGL